MNKQATQMTMEEMHKVAGGVTYTELRGVEIHRPRAASRRSIILRTIAPPSSSTQDTYQPIVELGRILFRVRNICFKDIP